MSDAPHTPAAFINAIAEEGSKKEAIEWLQKTWNELAETKRLLAEADCFIERAFIAHPNLDLDIDAAIKEQP